MRGTSEKTLCTKMLALILCIAVLAGNGGIQCLADTVKSSDKVDAKSESQSDNDRDLTAEINGEQSLHSNAIPSEGAAIVYSGKDGDLDWSIDSEGCLRISGVGDYEYRGYHDTMEVPEWCDDQYRLSVKSAIVNVSGIHSVGYMFYGCEELVAINLAGLDTSDVDYMVGMFGDCKSLETLDVSNFDTSNVECIWYMFCGCESLKTLDLSNFDTSNVFDMDFMFGDCMSLETLDLSNFDTSGVKEMSRMFQNCKSLQILDVSHFDTSSVENMNEMFEGCESLKTLDLSNFNTNNVTRMNWMFDGCKSLTALDISNFDTSNVTEMNYMFCECASLTTLDVSRFDTSNVAGMSDMFWRCENLTALDVSNFETSNVTAMGGMFEGCKSLTALNVSNFETSNVTNMYGMFSGCESLTAVDVSNFDTSNVTAMRNIFTYCNKLKSLDISNFDLDKVTDSEYIMADHWGVQQNTSLETVIFPANLNKTIYLPKQDGETWVDRDGNVCTEAIQGLDEPMTYYSSIGGGRPMEGEIDDIIEPKEVTVNSADVNGKGYAYVRYKLKEEGTTKSIPKGNVQVICEETKEVAKLHADANGFITLSTPTYVNDQNATLLKTCTFDISSLDDKNLATTKVIVKTTVYPVSYSSKMSASASTKVMLEEGAVGLKFEAGPLSGGAYAGAEVGGGKGVSISGEAEKDGKTGKTSMEFTKENNVSLKGEVKAQIGADWNASNAKQKENYEKATWGATIIKAGAGTDAVSSYGQSVKIADIDNISEKDVKSLSLFLFDVFESNYQANSLLSAIRDVIMENYHSSETEGKEVLLKANSSVLELSLPGNVKFTAAGIDGNAKYSYKSDKQSDKNEYTAAIDTDQKTSFLDFSVGNKINENKEEHTSLSVKNQLFGMSKDIKNAISITATDNLGTDEEDECELKTATTYEQGLILGSKSKTQYESHIVKGNAIQLLQSKNANLNRLICGKSSLMNVNEMSRAVEAFYDNDVNYDIKKSEATTTGFTFPLSLSAALGKGIGGELKLTGSNKQSYETGYEKIGESTDSTFQSAYLVGAASTPQNYIPEGNAIYLDALEQAKNSLITKIGEVVKKQVGKVVDGVKNGFAYVKGAVTAGTNRIVSITTTALSGGTLYTTAYATGMDTMVEGLKRGETAMIGQPYVVAVTEDDTELASFEDEPLEFVIAYNDELLAEANITDKQAKDIKMYYYLPDADTYEYVESINDTENQEVTAQITKSGQYLLGVDYAEPSVIRFEASNQSTTPTIYAWMDDISGIGSVTLKIDGDEVVNSTNMDSYLEGMSLAYKVVTPLSAGNHIATLCVCDTTGNEMSVPAELTFAVQSLPGQPIQNVAKPANTIQLGNTFSVGNNGYIVTAVKGNEAELTLVSTTRKTSVKVPDTVMYGSIKCKVTAIGDGAFKSGKMKTITIGKNITKIGKDAFKNCKKLKNVTIKSTKLKKIGTGAFKGIHKNAVIKVPKTKKKVYTKMIKRRGLPKTARIK